MRWLYWFFVSYLMFFLQSIFHELAHFIVAKVFKWHVKSVVIGCKKSSIRIRNLFVSPFLTGGYVEVLEGELLKANWSKTILFFEAGAMMNLMISFLPLSFEMNSYSSLWMSVGVLMAISVNMPFEGTDVFNIFAILKKKRGHKKESCKVEKV